MEIVWSMPLFMLTYYLARSPGVKFRRSDSRQCHTFVPDFLENRQSVTVSEMSLKTL